MEALKARCQTCGTVVPVAELTPCDCECGLVCADPNACDFRFVLRRGRLPGELPALTLWQPWALTVAYFSKTVENRAGAPTTAAPSRSTRA